MPGQSRYRGYYCQRCHAYTRLYRRRSDGSYRGTCAGCGASLYLSARDAEEGFFFSGRRLPQNINLWDSYLQREIVGQVERGTAARLLGQTRYNGVLWFHVKAGKLEGWISGGFVRRLR